MGLINPEKKEAIRADDYAAIRGAATNGHLKVIQYLLDSLSEAEKKSAIQADDYVAIREAAINGHLEVLKCLLDLLPEAERMDAIKAKSNVLIRQASRRQHSEIVNYLLAYKEVFSYMDNYDQKDDKGYVSSFVNQKIVSIQKNKANHEEQYPEDVFNLEDEEAAYALYMLRNLIRRGVGREHATAGIQLLLSIPSVKGQAHLALGTDFDGNALLRHAIQIGNGEAARILMGIPAVRELAAQHQNYLAEATILTDFIMALEMDEFVNAHFDSVITNKNAVALKQALDLISSAESDNNAEERKSAKEKLKSLEISSEEASEFNELLSNKYDLQAGDKLSSGSDFQVFNEQLDLEGLIKSKLSKPQESDAELLSRLSFFSSSEEPTKVAGPKTSESKPPQGGI
ncbi:MAG: ankyrin repeat domain-containing protein [Legionella sp.]|nr:ankyrin repeat domain-containing protein [Legionella sp.]